MCLAASEWENQTEAGTGVEVGTEQAGMFGPLPLSPFLLSLICGTAALLALILLTLTVILRLNSRVTTKPARALHNRVDSARWTGSCSSYAEMFCCRFTQRRYEYPGQYSRLGGSPAPAPALAHTGLHYPVVTPHTHTARLRPRPVSCLVPRQ